MSASSSDAIARIGWDNTEAKKGAADFVNLATSTKKRTDAVLAQVAGGRKVGEAMRGSMMRNVGGVSLQLQDIVIQAQSGARATTIIAQQGSQLLSAFGPMGMIAGATVALGAALWQVRQAGGEALKAIEKDVKDLDASMGALTTGSVEDMVTGFKRAQQQLKDLRDQQKASDVSFWARWMPDSLLQKAGGLGLPVFNTESDPKQRELREIALKNEKRLMDQILLTSGQEVRLMQMRASGRAREADELERKLKLQRKLAELDAQPAEIRDQLKADAIAASEAERAGKLAEGRNRIAEETARQAFDQLDTAEKINAVLQKQNDLLIEEDKLRAEGRLDESSMLELDQRRISLQGQLIQLQRQFNSEAEREAEIRKAAADQAARANEQRKAAVLSAMDEYNILKAKATARKSDDYAVERGIAIRKRRESLMRDNGLSFKDADKLATEMRDMEERAANGGRAPKIRGVKSPRRKSSLDEWHAKQGRAWNSTQTGSGQWDYLQRKGFDWEKDLIPGARPNNNNNNPLQDQAAANGAAGDASAPWFSRIVELLSDAPERTANALLNAS